MTACILETDSAEEIHSGDVEVAFSTGWAEAGNQHNLELCCVASGPSAAAPFI